LVYVELAKDAEKFLGVSSDDLISFVQEGAVRAYKAGGEGREKQDVVADWNPVNWQLDLMVKRKIVEVVKDPDREISIQDGLKLNPLGKPGEIVSEFVSGEVMDSVGVACALLIRRLASEIAIKRQSVITGKFEELKGKCVLATVKDDGEPVVVEVAGAEMLLPKEEQVVGEACKKGTQIVVFVEGVKESLVGGNIIVTRRAPELAKWLVRKYVPEVDSGVIEVKAVGRIPGKRSRIAVFSDQVDAIERCRGRDGKWIKAIRQALGGEEVDFVEWSGDGKVFVEKALCMRVAQVMFLEGQKKAKVELEELEKSMDGECFEENLILAEQLCGWEIDVVGSD
jgi:N utilization substance protein A